MESFEALRMAIGGHAVRVAKALGLSSSLVHKWCEPHTDFTAAGALNPLDRLETVINTALIEGQSPRQAFAPLYYLASRTGGLFLPPVPVTIETREYSKQLCRSVKEAGEAFTTMAEALEDDELSPNERRKIAKALFEAIATLSETVRMVESDK